MFAKCATFKLTKWDNQQNVLITFHNFPVHKCISWDILSLGRKWDILSSWDYLSPEKCQWNNGFSVGSSVGHFVAGEEMGHFVAGTICRMGRKWDILSSGTICGPKNASGTICRWDKMSPNQSLNWFVLANHQMCPPQNVPSKNRYVFWNIENFTESSRSVW